MRWPACCRDVTSDYDVPLMVSRGMPSLTFLHGSAQEILHAAQAWQADLHLPVW